VSHPYVTRTDPPRAFVAHTAPDSLGRQSITLFWWVPGDHPLGQPLDPRGGVPGFNRAQCFFCPPARFLETGAVLVADDKAAIRAAWGDNAARATLPPQLDLFGAAA